MRDMPLIKPVSSESLQDPLSKVGMGVDEPVVLGLFHQPVHKLRLSISHHNGLSLACKGNYNSLTKSDQARPG